ncbi:MAG TPA: response regulator, partial [Gemmatimonadaceae bacterium]|nr:response regulator [Gemmatimonadaceae bacterium]
MTADAPRIRVLVVDDEPPARKRLRTLLSTESDLEIIGEAASGSEAVKMIAAERPDLVFLDIQMPGLDGFGVIREIANDDPPLIVFVTAHDE